MQQVTNLLKELKNNSSGGYTSHTATNHLPQDDKSLKVQDLEKTANSQTNTEAERLRLENLSLKRKVDHLEKDLEL